jgi:hypothetical protein
MGASLLNGQAALSHAATICSPHFLCCNAALVAAWAIVLSGMSLRTVLLQHFYRRMFISPFSQSGLRLGLVARPADLSPSPVTKKCW